MLEKRNVYQLDFEGSFPKTPTLSSFPEVAFVGRSNVGKSSAINALLDRKKAARVSAQPGRTQLINCFLLNSTLRFVDLPGYGFAKVPPDVKKKWGLMIEGYLLNRVDLKLIVILVDVRHDPQTLDKQMIDVAKHYGIPFLVVATKADKITRNQVAKQSKILREGLGLSKQEFSVFSSLDNTGYVDVWSKIEQATGMQRF
jgi:GTP-binding protein